MATVYAIIYYAQIHSLGAGRKGLTMNYYIKSPARFCEGSNSFSTIDIIVDIENSRVELVSDDKKDVIRLDLIGADTLRDTLQRIADSERFQAELREKIIEHGGRNNAMNSSVP